MEWVNSNRRLKISVIIRSPDVYGYFPTQMTIGLYFAPNISKTLIFRPILKYD